MQLNNALEDFRCLISQSSFVNVIVENFSNNIPITHWILMLQFAFKLFIQPT